MNDENNIEKIYTDFNFQFETEPPVSIDSFSQTETPQVKQVIWGNHKTKPEIQQKWESAIESEINAMIEEKVQDYFPYMTHRPEIAKCNAAVNDTRPRARRSEIVQIGSE